MVPAFEIHHFSKEYVRIAVAHTQDQFHPLLDTISVCHAMRHENFELN
jgi:hypothetical protein